MKTFIAVCVIVLCALFFSGGSAVPVAGGDGDGDVDGPLNDVLTAGNAFTLEEAPIRQKRATCDALSIFGVNHSACAAHCLLKRYKGGYCNSRAVCVCRH